MVGGHLVRHTSILVVRQTSTLLLLFVALAGTAGCLATTKGTVPAGTLEPDKFLFDKGTAALDAKKWLTAREYYKQVVETYTGSVYRPDAKLAIGDTYLGEGSSEALVLAINEFQEFLTFYPTNRRADYAQYKLGLAHFRQMRAPQRDQTETQETIREFETFVPRYPDSSLMPEVKAKLREAHDRLSEADYLVGSSTSAAVVSRRDRSVQGGAQAGRRLHRSRRRVLQSRRVAHQDQAAGGSLTALRAPRRRIPAERVPGGGAQADHRAQGYRGPEDLDLEQAIRLSGPRSDRHCVRRGARERPGSQRHAG